MAWRAGVAALGVAGASAALILSGSAPAPVEPVELDDVPYEVVEAERRDLTERRQRRGVVSFGTSFRLGDRSGVVTSAPPAGTVVGPGEELVRIDDAPLELADGAMPMYRELGWQRGDPLVGDDVRQLQEFLVGRGYDVSIDGVFGLQTRDAVRSWERDVGHVEDGRVDAGQVVFHDGPVRVVDAGTVGEPFDGAVVTSIDPEVVVRTTTADAPFFATGVEVAVDHPAVGDLVGRVVDVAAVVEADGRPALDVRIAISGPVPEHAIELRVTAHRTVARDVLAVPVRALLPLGDGAWAVEIPAGSGRLDRRLVEIGAAADGWVEIERGLEAGEPVAVPR